MIKSIREFKPAFDICMDYYGVTGDELEFEKQRVRDNMEDGQECYFSIAEKIKIITRNQGSTK